MQIKVKTEDQNGNIIFDGVLNKQEIDLVLNIGINFLLANGALELLTDKDAFELASIAPSTTTPQ